MPCYKKLINHSLTAENRFSEYQLGVKEQHKRKKITGKNENKTCKQCKLTSKVEGHSGYQHTARQKSYSEKSQISF